MNAKLLPDDCRAKLHKVRCHPVNRYAAHAEHIGFVAYAGVETLGLHALLYLVSVWLLATGLWVCFGKVEG